MRWARNTWRSDLRALLLDRWVWTPAVPRLLMADKAVGGFTLLAGPLYLAAALVHGNWRSPPRWSAGGG